MIHDLIEAVKSGNLAFIQDHLPDWNGEKKTGTEPDEDEFAFLDEFQNPPPQELQQLVNTPGRDGLNLLDVVCQTVILCRSRDEDPRFLAPIALELIVKKGAWVSNKSLEMMYKTQEYQSFRETDRKVHRFRRTMGLFASAAFSFNKLGQSDFLASQSWANRRLYGIAAVIHSDVPSANIISSSKLLHPNFLKRLDVSQGKSEIRNFLEILASDKVMMNKIQDNHAHRFMTVFLRTSTMEREVCRYAGSSQSLEVSGPGLDSLIQRTVLLVDDHDEHRLKISGWLVKNGFQVAPASDGQEALAYFRKNQSKIELVLTDFGMPHMDGLNLATELRGLNGDLPIIINTTPPIHPDLVHAANLIDVAVIRKHDMGLLKQAINQALTR